jgi:hypothetical protein
MDKPEPQRMKIDDFLDKHCSETCDKAGLTDCAVDFESCAKSRQLKIILEWDERNMSETPICDKHKYETDLGAEVVPLEIAQKLERMLKNAEIAAETYRLEAQKAKSEQSAEMLKSERAANVMLTEELDMFLAEQQAMGEIIESKDRQLAEARAEIEKQDTLLEKCLCLLKQQKEKEEL